VRIRVLALLNWIPKRSLVTQLRQWGTLVAACAALGVSVISMARTDARVQALQDNVAESRIQVEDLRTNLAQSRIQLITFEGQEHALLTAPSPVGPDMNAEPEAEMLTDMVTRLCPDNLHVDARRNPRGAATFEQAAQYGGGEAQLAEDVIWYRFSTQDGRWWLHSVTATTLELSAQRGELDTLAHKIVDPVIQDAARLGPE
jgi:hypothetical protein